MAVVRVKEAVDQLPSTVKGSVADSPGKCRSRFSHDLTVMERL